MNIATNKYKIVEVWATAWVLVKRHGYTVKCAKHYCALVVKQSEGGISYRKLADFLENDEIGRILGYKRKFSYTIFSKIRSRPDTKQIIEEIFAILVSDTMRGKQVTLLAQDSTDISHIQGKI
ncbi:MAG: hypothetical protein QXH07_03890 [Thermoplasmata archaeon]